MPAGTLHWWRAWVFLGVTLGATAGAVLSILPDSTGLLSERSREVIQRGQPLWDRVLVILLVASYVGQIVFIPLDVFRFHLMLKPGMLVSSFGLALYVDGWWILTRAMKVNPFAVPVVRLQEERHQRVIDTDIYAVVRHPMYAGFVPFVVGPALWLESYAAALARHRSDRGARGAEHARGTIFETRTTGLRSVHGKSPLQADPIHLVETRPGSLEHSTHGSLVRRQRVLGFQSVFRCAEIRDPLSPTSPKAQAKERGIIT